MPHTRMQAVVDATSTTSAGVLITTHYWLPLVREGSEWVAALLPYAGFAVAVLQIIYWSRRIWRRGR